MRNIKVLLPVLFLLLICSTNGYSWNRPGHMVTGAIAYKVLKQTDPQALDRVLNIFREHPFYEEEWLPAIQALPGNHPDKEGLYLFMHAARWPDDIRGDEEFDCGVCHYVNFRFRPSQPNAALVSVGGELLDAFDENVQIIEGNSSTEDKAIALSWIFHLVGDVHQPLHTATLVTPRFSAGDRGGTRFYIRATATSRPISLHQFWDGLIIGSQRFNAVNNRATQLLEDPALQRNSLTELSETDFNDWAQVESFRLAKRDGYRNGTLRGGTRENNSELLPDGYAGVVQPIAERRAVLAGYRIADRLREWF